MKTREAREKRGRRKKSGRRKKKRKSRITQTREIIEVIKIEARVGSSATGMRS